MYTHIIAFPPNQGKGRLQNIVIWRLDVHEIAELLREGLQGQGINTDKHEKNPESPQ